jgi:hypothetical protein
MLNKLILNAFLSISLAFSFAGAANATLISQDLISDVTGNVIGTITINTTPSEIADYGLSDVFVFEEFNLFGLDMTAPAIADGNQFFASFETENYSLGLQDLSFDLVDTLGALAWNGQFFGGFGGFDAFDLGVIPNPAFVGYFEFTLGNATVVPTPTTLVLFLTAVVGLVARRKTH